MVVRRKIATLTGCLAVAVVLTGCQETHIAGVSVSPTGSVTLSETSAVTYDTTGGNVTVVKPDPAKLLAAAKKGTRAFVGPGAGKPVITLRRVGPRRLVLIVSQTLASIALANKHAGQFDAASLSLTVVPKPGAPQNPDDPYGVHGPRTESVVLDSDDGGAQDPRDDGGSLALTHVGHQWRFLIAENAKTFTKDRAELAQLFKSLQQQGVPINALSDAVHMQLPGRIVSTNGKRLGGGTVSWDLLHPTSPSLSLITQT